VQAADNAQAHAKTSRGAALAFLPPPD